MAKASYDKWQSGKTLSECATFMLDNEIATDVTIKFQNTDEIIKAHRFVLMARSHVYYAMFASDLDKHGEAIEITDIKPSIFKEFLRYLYSDSTALTVEAAISLISCAERYEVTDLKAKCTDFLLQQLDERTVAMVLDVFHNDDVLTSTCQDIIESLETLSFLEQHHITRDTLDLILGFEGLAVREVEIFRFCNKWAENECKEKDAPVNTSNKRRMLGPLLGRIPFCSMTQEEFATAVSGKHLLNGKEELQIFRFICSPDKTNPPFPCKVKKETEKPAIAVKLPADMWDTSQDLCRSIQDNLPFELDIWCSQPCTLLGIRFTKTGNFAFQFNGNCQCFSIERDDLHGSLKTPVQYCPSRYQTINNISPLHSAMVPQHHSFSHNERVKGNVRPIQLDLTVESYGKPPFDTLIFQV